MPNMTGGLIVIAPNAQKVATGYTGRRPVVEDARCNACHQAAGHGFLVIQRPRTPILDNLRAEPDAAR